MNEQDKKAYANAFWAYAETKVCREIDFEAGWQAALEYARSGEPVAKAVMGKREVSCHGPNRKYVDGIVIQQLKEIEPDTFLYTHPAPAVAQGEADGWHFKFNSGAESFVTNVDAADLIRMGLQAGETCTEYFKKAITAEVGLSKTETTTEAPAVAQEPLDVLREVVSQYKQMNEWRMRHQCDSPELGAEEKELLHRAALAIAISAAEKVLDAQPAVVVNEQMLEVVKRYLSNLEAQEFENVKYDRCGDFEHHACNSCSARKFPNGEKEPHDPTCGWFDRAESLRRLVAAAEAAKKGGAE